MLTQSEREWLENRKHKAYCRYCNVSKLCANPFASGYFCPLTSNIKDALEFAERVLVKLADIYSEVESEICHVCPAWRQCFGKQDCRATILKYARLAVEEEMDGK